MKDRQISIRISISFFKSIGDASPKRFSPLCLIGVPKRISILLWSKKSFVCNLWLIFCDWLIFFLKVPTTKFLTLPWWLVVTNNSFLQQNFSFNFRKKKLSLNWLLTQDYLNKVKNNKHQSCFVIFFSLHENLLMILKKKLFDTLRLSRF